MRTLLTAASVVALSALTSSMIPQRPTPAAPGDHTVINFPKATPIDKKVLFAGGPITMTVDVHVHPPGDPSISVCISASITVASGDKSRREMAECMAILLKEALVEAGLSEEAACDLVSVAGATVYVFDTPPGEGPNSGTPEEPTTSPEMPNPNRIHAQYFSSQG